MNTNRKYSNCFNKQESSSEKELSALIEYESRRGKFPLSRYDKYFEYSYVFEEKDKWQDTQAQRPAIHKSSGSQASVPACLVSRKSTLQKTGFYNGGTLPHYDIKYAFQFITIREYGSIPQSIIRIINDKVSETNTELLKNNSYCLLERESRLQLLRLRLLEKYQDCGYGRCIFKHRKISQIIKESLLYFNEQRYEIISWVIMPNHIHLLVRLNKDNELSRFIHCLKSTTTNRINKLLSSADKIWSKDYFDRYIRDYSHYCKTIKYIELNPMKAGLCRSYEEWEFSSGYRNTGGLQASVPASLEEPLLSLAGTEACDP